MIPHGTPTKSFSACWASSASRSRVMRSENRSRNPSATEHSSAADDERPAPIGTLLSMWMSAPPTGRPASRSAQATPNT